MSLTSGASAGIRFPCRRLPNSYNTSIMPAVMRDKRKLSFAFFENLRVPMVMRQKLRRIIDNNLTKIRRLRGCCGDYGQPGC